MICVQPPKIDCDGGRAGDHDRRPGHRAGLGRGRPFLHELLPWLGHSAFPVVDGGQTVGLVTVRRVNLSRQNLGWQAVG